MSFEPPQSLLANRYRLLGELGQGASSRVYRARDEAGGGAEEVAIKLFGGPVAMASAESWARFRREAEALLGLEHPNIVRVFALGEHEGAPYLSMELVGGGSLEGELRSRQQLGGLPSSDEVGRWLLGAARGLAFAHARGVVHRDLKPANLLLDQSEGRSEIKIADFGVAMLAGADEASRAWVIGTPAYMAPEQCYAIDADVDERSDLFALGVVAYELLTGRRPYRAGTLAQYVRELATARPEPPRSARGGVDPMLEAIALRLLRIRPDERYQTARGLAHDLERWARHGLGVVFEMGAQDRRGALAGKAPLVGRGSELARLQDAWARAQRGDGGAVWLEGGAGSGKTRLLEALGPAVLGAGGRLVRGKNYELVTPSPFRALADAVRDLLAQLELGPEEERQQVEGQVRRALDGRADLLVRILPELSSLLGSSRFGPVPLAPEGGSFLLRETFARFFTGLASIDRPLALVVDDAQWSDEDSLAVLRALGRAAEGNAMLLVVARRRGEGPAAAEMRPPVAAPALIELGPLGEAQVAELVLGLLGPGSRAAARAVTAWVLPRAAGSPLFVRELVLGLVTDGALACEPEGGWAFDEARLAEAEPPPNVSAALVRRARLVSESSRAVLVAAAAVGPVVPFDALRALCPERPVGALVEALDEACRYALLGRAAGGAYFFTSEEARRAFYERVSPAERASLHGTMLERYEAERAEGERVPPSELVRHALAVSDVGRVARYAGEAAREAGAMYAHRSAARYYELAIASSTPEARPPLLVALAEALL
ncbi:MAG TPA: protein kinase, partial [Polyangiaceae bacterium]|nr:protein kinase [Polyangiaceae bacterium]